MHIDTVGLGCVETPDKIKQSCLVAPHERHFQIVHHLLQEHISKVPDYKETDMNARETFKEASIV
ncbi:hypothetical protein Ddye_029147 [Dipteronia dyeriana]|uniref:Uncharacterized protein n=1 Tax=Dipteronia dyeriana TaxID=168575 RepID=A0AAD9TDU4_9ROSI|nr:hypothetical protein Ddye_029147 [Dipteronia dyeriana]